MELAQLRAAVEKAIADYHRKNGLSEQCTADTLTLFYLYFDPEYSWDRKAMVTGSINNAHYLHGVPFPHTAALVKIINDLFSRQTASPVQRVAGDCDGLLDVV